MTYSTQSSTWAFSEYMYASDSHARGYHSQTRGRTSCRLAVRAAVSYSIVNVDCSFGVEGLSAHPRLKSFFASVIESSRSLHWSRSRAVFGMLPLLFELLCRRHRLSLFSGRGGFPTVTVVVMLGLSSGATALTLFGRLSGKQ